MKCINHGIENCWDSMCQNLPEGARWQSPTYARTQWSPEDVLELRPDWSYSKALKWLHDNEKHIRNRLVELGWEVIEDLLPPKGRENE